ncbi:YezD family protein [Lysinibacillus sp. NPDC094177]|uniref:YezD family protein n=1 Tax=Lysinibacillus sp. NPDC094177 TaxID=3390580 RepID=UPI003D063384
MIDVRTGLFCTKNMLKEGVYRMTQQAKVDNRKLEAIAKAIQNLEFGEVHITIQDGVIVQINRLEKQRFPQKK